MGIQARVVFVFLCCRETVIQKRSIVNTRISMKQYFADCKPQLQEKRSTVSQRWCAGYMVSICTSVCSLPT